MAKGPGTLADDLADEALAEMADTFFGERKEIEDLVEHIEAVARHLRDEAPRILDLGAALHGLLSSPEVVREMYAAVDVDPKPFLALVPARPRVELDMPKPFALTAAGRFAKQGLAAYQAFQVALDDYLHGVYEDHPEYEGRKRLKPNLEHLGKLVVSVNERIVKVNEAPGQVLSYAHRLDVAEVERAGRRGRLPTGRQCFVGF